jgi:hypothetical protein
MTASASIDDFIAHTKKCTLETLPTLEGPANWAQFTKYDGSCLEDAWVTLHDLLVGVMDETQIESCAALVPNSFVISEISGRNIWFTAKAKIGKDFVKQLNIRVVKPWFWFGAGHCEATGTVGKI